MEAQLREELRSINLKEHIGKLEDLGITSPDAFENFSDEQLQAEGFSMVQCILMRQAAEDLLVKTSPDKKPQKSASKKALAAHKKKIEEPEEPKDEVKIDWATFPKRSVHQTVSRDSAAALCTNRIDAIASTRPSTDVPWVRAQNAKRAGELIVSGKTAVRCGGPDIPRSGSSYSTGDNRVATLDAISSAVKESKGIRHLDLAGYHLGVPGGVSLADALSANRSLWHLDLGGCALGVEGGSAIAKALQKNRTIVHLNLRENSLCGEGAAAIGEVMKANKIMKHLDLSHNELGPDGGRTIAKALGTNTSLTYLNLGYNALGSEGGAALVESLGLRNRGSSVHYLDLRHNNIKAEGIKAITKVIRNNPSFTLRDIVLAGNALRHQDVQALTGALRLNRIVFYRPSPYYD